MAHATAIVVDSRPFGEATVTLISDATFPWAPSLLVPEQAWRAEMPEANERGEILLDHLIAYIRLGDASVLVDAGYGDRNVSPLKPMPGIQRTAGVQAALESMGVSPEEVTHVLITHPHHDHIAGLTVERDGRRVPRFPKALHFIGRADAPAEPNDVGAAGEAAADTHLDPLEVIARHGMLEGVDGDIEVVPGITLVHAPGESPGHSIVRLQSGGDTFYYLGDLFHHPCEIAHPDWISPFRDRTAVQASRERLLADAVANQATLVYTHAPFPGWGRVVRTGAGYHWERK